MSKENTDRLRLLGRNDQCSCGSGKKYKKCHLLGDEKNKAADRLPVSLGTKEGARAALIVAAMIGSGLG